MKTTDITSLPIWENGGATFLARVQSAGLNIVQVDVTSIERKIFDKHGDTPTTAIDTQNLVVANTIFDTLQTDGYWSADNTGYNFRDVILPGKFADGNHDYRVEYKILGAAGRVAWIVFIVSAKEIWSI